MLSPKPVERRRTQRYDLGRLAAMYVGNDDIPRHCIVNDFSEEGVRITSHGFGVPNEFVLRFSNEGRLKNGMYKVIWRNQLIVGAKFVGDARSGLR